VIVDSTIHSSTVQFFGVATHPEPPVWVIVGQEVGIVVGGRVMMMEGVDEVVSQQLAARKRAATIARVQVTVCMTAKEPQLCAGKQFGYV
jgi:hypothetical protein